MKEGKTVQEIIRKYLKDDKKLLRKYSLAENKYYKKLGDKYATIDLDICLDEKTTKNMFHSLAKAGICFDDYMLCLIKIEIVRKEMEKL